LVDELVDEPMLLLVRLFASAQSILKLINLLG